MADLKERLEKAEKDLNEAKDKAKDLFKYHMEMIEQYIGSSERNLREGRLSVRTGDMKYHIGQMEELSENLNDVLKSWKDVEDSKDDETELGHELKSFELNMKILNKMKSSSIAKKLDRIATELEQAGRPDMALALDSVSDRLENKESALFMGPGMGRGYGPGLGTGRGFGPGRGRGMPAGPGYGLGLGGMCVCPECGYKTEHARANPCLGMPCPECGVKMVREVE